MKIGRIYLLDKNNNVVRCKKYFCKTRRQKTIAMWKKEYGNKLDGCSFHIAPDDKYVEQTVNEKTGMNKRKDYKERRKKLL